MMIEVRNEIVNDHVLVGSIVEDNTWFIAVLTVYDSNGEFVNLYERTADDFEGAKKYIDETIDELKEIY